MKNFVFQALLKIEFIEKERTNSKIIGTININWDFLIKELSLKLINTTFEFINNTSTNKKFSQNIIIDKNDGMTRLKMELILNKAWIFHYFIEIDYKNYDKNSNLKNYANERILQNSSTTSTFMVSPVNKTYSTDPNCSIPVIFIFLN